MSLHNVSIVNGRYTGNNTSSNFTCHNHNGGKSVIDYAVASPMIFNHLSNFYVHEFDEFLSDTHCPISVSFKCQNNSTIFEEKSTPLENTTDPLECNADTHSERKMFNIIWNDEGAARYKESFNNDDVQNFSNILDALCMSPNQKGIDDFYNGFGKLVIDKAISSNICKEKKSVNNKK